MGGGFGTGSFGELPFGLSDYADGGSGDGDYPDIGTIVEMAYPDDGGGLRRVDYVTIRVTNWKRNVDDIVFTVRLTDGTIETAWTFEGGFTQNYRRGSSRVPIPYGHIYYFRRTGSWTTAILGIDVDVSDLATETVGGQA